MTLKRLASELGGELVGNGDLRINSIKDIEEAESGDIAFVFRKRFEFQLEKTRATCVIVPHQVKKSSIPIIKCKNPNLAFKKSVELLLTHSATRPNNVHKIACVGKGVKIGKGTGIGAYAILEDCASVGDRTVVYPHSYVGHGTSIGKDCLIYPNVTIRENVIMGNNVIVHPGSVIGSDGYGYEKTEKGHEKIPHLGRVIIEDLVEIGACVTVDRAKISNTRIGKGTKIDNLVQIAHNVTIGENCIIVAQCGISGSVKIGNNVMMGGQVGIADNMEIGDNAMLAAQAAIMKSVPPNAIMWGKPARPFKKAKEIYALFDKLPDIYERLKAVERKLGIR